MKKEITVNDLLCAYPVVKEIYNQDIKFSIGTGIKLLQLYKEFDEYNSYILNRIKILIPNIVKEGYELAKDENIIYEAILMSTIEIDTYGLTCDDLEGKNDIVINIKSLDKLLSVL